MHIFLAAYLWLIAAVPLGNWNKQFGQYLLTALLQGRHIEPGDAGFLIFVMLPAILAILAWRRRSLWLLISALLWDLIWLAMQVQSWWIPYAFGTNRQWQLQYAKGPDTRILPSFGNHVAPDAIHFLITVLLVVAMSTGIAALRQLRSNGRPAS